MNAIKLEEQIVKYSSDCPLLSDAVQLHQGCVLVACQEQTFQQWSVRGAAGELHLHLLHEGEQTAFIRAKTNGVFGRPSTQATKSITRRQLLNGGL